MALKQKQCQQKLIQEDIECSLNTRTQVCYPFLQLLHKTDRIGERFSLLTRQRLQVQDGLCALGLKNSNGLQQPLITDMEGGKVRQW